LPPHPVIEGRWPDICLTNYFNIKKSGEYELTIWPKIYKRSAKDRDLCERIDVPPVTIPIKWDGKSP
jgi:hypothetical protein